MLKDLNEIRQEHPFEYNPSSLKDFKLPDDFLLALRENGSLREKGYVFDYYTSLKYEKSGKYHIFPNQYFRIIADIAPQIMETGAYTKILNNFKKSAEVLKSKNTFQEIKKSNLAKKLNDDEIKLFSNFINQESYRKGKEVVDRQGVRNDILESSVLSSQPLVKASSGIFGTLAEDLAEDSNVLKLCKKLSNNIIVDTRINNFVLRVIQFLINKNKQDALFNLLVDNGSNEDNFNLELNGEKITTIFKITDHEIDERKLSSSGKPRFFTPPINHKNKYFYLSTEWTNNKASRTDLKPFQKIFNSLYKDYKIKTSENEGKNYFYLCNYLGNESMNSTRVASNTILFGAPGVGKSYKIKEIISSDACTKTVFHAETQNSDFIGCLKPSMDENDRQKIIYSFKPGPFTEALIKATLNKEENHWLVIEEINRASAATVFGEIFQLLDRNAEGESDYGIKLADTDMISYLNQETDNSFPDGEIKIPKNLSLIASMNSSDQAVMPMDTAFKRRWQFEYIPIDLDGNQCSQGNITINFKDRGSKEIKWQIFAKTINEILSKERIPEDKHLGQFFLSQKELKPENQENSLTGKVFIYLWDDVLKHRQSIVFKDDITTFGKLIQQYKEDGIVFSEDFYRILAKFSDSELHQDINVGEKDEQAPEANDH